MALHFFNLRKRLELSGPEARRFEHFVVADVDDGLKDISDEALGQLTRLLHLSPKLRGEGWLLDQVRQMRQLDPCLLRPKGLIDRLAISMGKHGAPFSPSRANLCLTHKPLDPRVVRKLMVLVADECTVQVDRFRSARARDSVDMAPAVRCWLERMDSATALWLRDAQFKDLFQRAAPWMGGPTSEHRRCEACIMAVVGGWPQMVLDLRVGLLARRAYTAEKTGTERDPRLLRAVEAWARVHGATNEQRIAAHSEALVGRIVQVRKDISAHRERRRRGKYRRRGCRPPPRTHRRTWTELTREGLPMPRRRRAALAGNESQSTFLSTAACTSEERLALVGHRRTDSSVALRNGEAGGVDPRAWLEGIPEGREDEEEAYGWEHDHVSSREGKMSPLPRPGEVSELTAGDFHGSTLRTISELSSRTEMLDELAGSRPGPSAPQSVSAMSSLSGARPAREDITPPRNHASASTYTLDSYYFKVAGRRSCASGLPPVPDLPDLDPSCNTDDDDGGGSGGGSGGDVSDDESTSTSVEMEQRMGALCGHNGKRGRPRMALNAEALRMLQEEDGSEDEGVFVNKGVFVNEDIITVMYKTSLTVMHQETAS